MAQDIRSKVVLGIDVNEFRQGITKVDSSIKGITRQFQNLGGIIGASFAVGKIQQFTVEAVKLGSELSQVSQGFKRFGTATDLNNLRKATRGLVTDLELMKVAVQAGNFGIPIKDMGNLLEFASRRAAETGQSVDYLVNSIVTGIGRKSPLILDNLGISAVRLKEQFNGAALEAQSVGDVAAAVGRIATEELKQMGEPVESVADDLQRLSVEFENFKAIFGVAVSPALLTALKALEGAALAIWKLGQGNYIQAFMGLITGTLPGAPSGIGTGGQFPALPDAMQVAQQGIFGAFPGAATPAAAEKKKTTAAKELKESYIDVVGEMERMYQLEKQFLLQDWTPFDTTELKAATNMLQEEFIPILKNTQEQFGGLSMMALEFGNILRMSFEASLISGEDFFTVFKEGVKNYIKQVLAMTAATTALAVAIAFVTGGANFKKAFNVVGAAMGTPFGFEGGEFGLKGRDFFFGFKRNQSDIIRNGG